MVKIKCCGKQMQLVVNQDIYVCGYCGYGVEGPIARSRDYELTSEEADRLDAVFEPGATYRMLGESDAELRDRIEAKLEYDEMSELWQVGFDQANETYTMLSGGKTLNATDPVICAFFAGFAKMILHAKKGQS